MAVRYFCYNVKESVVFMYRVMIIDDEKALRNLLKASVDWQEMGLEVVGEAASGIEATFVCPLWMASNFPKLR